jgi:hypothetical protein
LTPEQATIELGLRQLVEEARRLKLDLAVILCADDGFYLMGSCCEPCAHALIHTAADMVDDPRDNLPVFDGQLIVVQ